MAGRVAYYGGIVKDGLVLDLDAAKKESYPGSGTVWNDIAGGVVTGSLTNGPTFDGNNGGSIVFDGTNDCVNLPNIPSLRPNVFTVVSWVNCNISNSNQKTIFSIYSQVSGVAGFGFQQWNGTNNGINRIRFFVGNNTFTYGEYTGTINVPINTWNQIVVSYDGTTMINYVNGIVDGSLIYNSGCVYDPPNNLTQIGSIINSGYFPGKISYTQLYNRALSAAEITQNYNALKGRYGL
jgi:hypothetical protein